MAAEPDEVSWVFRFLNPLVKRGVMLDVGAHAGSSLVEFAAAGWNVHAFEPDAENRRRLCWLVNGASNVVIDSRAVSDRSGEKRAFYRSPVSSGISSLLPFHPTHDESAEVETVALGDYLAKAGVQAIDFLKIDTEGNDAAVLRGMDFGRFRPRVVVCEFDDAKAPGDGANVRSLVDFLVGLDYSVLLSVWQPLAEYGSGHRWQQMTRDVADVEVGQWGNIIAMSSGDVAAFVGSLEPRLTVGL